MVAENEVVGFSDLLSDTSDGIASLTSKDWGFAIQLQKGEGGRPKTKPYP